MNGKKSIYAVEMDRVRHVFFCFRHPDLQFSCHVLFAEQLVFRQEWGADCHAVTAGK